MSGWRSIPSVTFSFNLGSVGFPFAETILLDALNCLDALVVRYLVAGMRDVFMRVFIETMDAKRGSAGINTMRCYGASARVGVSQESGGWDAVAREGA